MKICIFGAGAIGGYLGARLCAAGAGDVTLIARGAHLDAMKKEGLTLYEGETRLHVRPTCTGDPAAAGPQDYVIVTAKAGDAEAAAATLSPLFHEETAVVTAQNGIPWWYFYRSGGPFEGHRLKSVDPAGRQWEEIGPERAIGCVVYPAVNLEAPGVLRHMEGDRFILGEPDGTLSPRLKALSRALISAGIKAPLRKDIRTDIWVKLWGNLAFNPLSVLTGMTLEELATTPKTRDLARAMMVEAAEVASRLGVSFPIGVDQRIEGTAKVGAHKTSMLQDYEKGRKLEIDALLGVVAELGDLTAVETPQIDAILAEIRALGGI